MLSILIVFRPGRGGQSCWGRPFQDEFCNELTHNKRGILSMANSGPNTNGSQFFITFQPRSHLDKKHTVFGEVTNGLEVLDEIEAIPTGKVKAKRSLIFYGLFVISWLLFRETFPSLTFVCWMLWLCLILFCIWMRKRPKWPKRRRKARAMQSEENGSVMLQRAMPSVSLVSCAASLV